MALVWAAFRARSRRRLIGWSFLAVILLPLAGSALATITGLATGATEPTGWPWMLVTGMFIGYSLALVATGAGGLLLLYDLFRPRPDSRLQPASSE